MNLMPDISSQNLQGASKLVSEVEDAVKLVLENPANISVVQFPTISNQRTAFPPVLFLSSLIEVTGHLPSIDELPVKLHRAYRILLILNELQAGDIDFSKNLLKYLSRQMDAYISWKDTSALFDLFYGALQLLVHAELVEPEKAADAHDLFMMTCGIGLVIAEMINARSLPDHIDHFKVHASVYLAARNSNQQWSDVLDASAVYLEKWGDEPPPPSVLIHAAHNHLITVQGLPLSDQVYELIKAARKEVLNDKTLDINSAFAMLNDTLGWRQSAAIIRLLWDSETRRYYNYTRDAVKSCQEAEGFQAAFDYAQRIQFVGDDGCPLLKPLPETPAEDGATLSFPGGAGIGKTCIICKIAGLYLMIDYGRDQFGRTPHWRPEMDLLDAVLITHAHQDHIGGLLDLYGAQGYEGPWYATAESEALIRLSLTDSVGLERSKFGEKARHTEDHVDKIFSHFKPLSMGVAFKLADKVFVTPYDAGHVAGSCQYHLESFGASLFFSGDFNLAPCRSVSQIKMPSDDLLKSVDAVVVEGTYAFREEKIIEAEDAVAELLRTIREQEKRPVLVPVLSLGRAQEVIAALSGTELKVGVFGMARKMTLESKIKVGDNVVFDARNPSTVPATEYDVLVASSGCLQGGPSKIFFERKDLLPIPTVLTGYLFPGTMARTLSDKLPRVRFSAHASHAHWSEYLGRFPNAEQFLIHYPGDRTVQLPENLTIPKLGKAYRVKKRTTVSG